jgi:hypothetical protein
MFRMNGISKLQEHDFVYVQDEGYIEIAGA